MKYGFLFLFFSGLCLLLPERACAQKKRTVEYRVMFYNVENLFDTEDDPHKLDNEFLPAGRRRWTPFRYYTHLRQTARVISAAGEWDTPALVGLCEVENDSVVTHLLTRTPLRTQRYRYCMTGGHDIRGINNALLYQTDKFRYLGHECSRIRFTNRRKRSRDILHVWGRVVTGDTLDVFVCHFPSRSGGVKETERDRLDAARQVRHLSDSLYRIRRTPNLLVMGDFNDTPADTSIRALTVSASPARTLLNLFADRAALNAGGTYKYRGEWSQIDQMMVSKSWRRYLKEGSPRIFSEPFLMTEDKSKGLRPKRSYYGFKYEGGFSDHLPIVADFLLPLAN
jgi:endonuclease/exonuclease/phosphatase family metal-dependent hydrolase